jgi:hypothetical protein
MTAHRAWLVIFAASSAFVIAACGETASEPSATVPPATAPVSTSSPAAAASTSSPTVAPSAAGITGYGATVADWNSYHTQAPFCDPGGCYDPDPSLAQVNGHEGVRYFAVSTTNGRVLDYSMAFAHGTPQSVASATVMREFPGDAQVLWTTTKDTCSQMEISSPTLGGLLGSSSIGDPQGEVFVEFDSDEDTAGNNSYSPSSVREAILGLGSYATAGSAPAC